MSSASARRAAAVLDLSELRRRVAGLERAARLVSERSLPTLPLGPGSVADALSGGGLLPGALHEVAGRAGEGAAALAFTAALAGLALRATPERWVLWCRLDAAEREAGQLYLPGLAGFAIDAGRLLLARVRRPADLFWAMEEGLRSPALVAVVGEGALADLTVSRRLQLAAAAGGGFGFLLAPPGAALPPSAAITRWRVAAHPAPVGAPSRRRLHVALERSRGRPPAAWIMDWNDATVRFDLAAPLADRSLAPPAFA